MVIQALKLVTEPANMVVYIGIFWGYDGDNNPDEFIIEKHSFNKRFTRIWKHTIWDVKKGGWNSSG